MRNYFIIVSIKQSSKFEKLNDLSAYVIFLIAENAQQVISALQTNKSIVSDAIK